MREQFASHHVADHSSSCCRLESSERTQENFKKYFVQGRGWGFLMVRSGKVISWANSVKSKPHRHAGKSKQQRRRLEVGAFLAVGGTVRTQWAQSGGLMRRAGEGYEHSDCLELWRSFKNPPSPPLLTLRDREKRRNLKDAQKSRSARWMCCPGQKWGRSDYVTESTVTLLTTLLLLSRCSRVRLCATP